MPVEQERALHREGRKLAKAGKLRKRKKGESTEEAIDRFVYGIMRKRGWKPSAGDQARAIRGR